MPGNVLWPSLPQLIRMGVRLPPVPRRHHFQGLSLRHLERIIRLGLARGPWAPLRGRAKRRYRRADFCKAVVAGDGHPF